MNLFTATFGTPFFYIFIVAFNLFLFAMAKALSIISDVRVIGLLLTILGAVMMYVCGFAWYLIVVYIVVMAILIWDHIRNHK